LLQPRDPSGVAGGPDHVALGVGQAPGGDHEEEEADQYGHDDHQLGGHHPSIPRSPLHGSSVGGASVAGRKRSMTPSDVSCTVKSRSTPGSLNTSVTSPRTVMRTSSPPSTQRPSTSTSSSSRGAS